MEMSTLRTIREKERDSHIIMYSNQELYNSTGWLKKPVKSIMNMIPFFRDYNMVRILDLGCGVGRNSIAIAKELSDHACVIECVDILELVVEKLNMYARNYRVSDCIHGIAMPIEEYVIRKNCYDWILAVSALEHIDSTASFLTKLYEIRDGLCCNGIVALILNSSVTEKNKQDGKMLTPQFEVNLPTEKLQAMLNDVFHDWRILENHVRVQQYDVPRESGIGQITTHVITFIAQKKMDGEA